MLAVHSFYLQGQKKSAMPPLPTRSNSLNWKIFDAPKSVSNGILTRGKRTSMALGENRAVGKRKADSPLVKASKRSAFGDLTNAHDQVTNDTKKALKNVANTQSKALSKSKEQKVDKDILTQQDQKKKLPVRTSSLNVPKPASRKTATAPATRSSNTTLLDEGKNLPAKAQEKKIPSSKNSLVKPSARTSISRTSSLCVPKPVYRKAATATSNTSLAISVPKRTSSAIKDTSKEPVRSSARLSARLSLTSEVEEQSLYVSALDISPDDGVGSLDESEALVLAPAPISPKRKLPPGVEDFDAENVNDPFQVSEYAMDVFEYLKEREPKYCVPDYMERQVCLTRYMRALLVDWMVEVQENFELNHETLYLAVKIVDLYLSKVIVGKETLQLVGAASLFIASKFDERVPPLVDDLTYICDGAYSHEELIGMEVNILRIIDFDLSMPLSYRFLRRYARCAKIAMPQLTLARYILELSLMEYSMVTLSDSKIAAASLLISLKMQNLGSWTPTLEYYSGYKVEDIKDICLQLNEMLHKKPKTALATVRNKYSHKVFFEVANIPLVDDLKL